MDKINMDKLYDTTYDERMENDDDNDINNKIYQDTILSGKIHESLEDPVSQTLYDISEVVSPTLYAMGVTPNMITATRLLFVFSAAIYFFPNRYYRTTSILFFLAYFGDCLDGHMARKYDMDTEFGDYFDHLADAVSLFLTLYIISVYIHPEFDWLVIVLVLLTVLSLVQIGCEERYLQIMGIGKDSDTLSGITGLCPKSAISDTELEDLMEYSRLVGIGVTFLILVIIMWNFEYFENDAIV